MLRARARPRQSGRLWRWRSIRGPGTQGGFTRGWRRWRRTGSRCGGRSRRCGRRGRSW
uniref:Uncharacterized protein n=1 Tax=Arundo donax TaxID=35708 RepID=A0A0A9FB84_ARUDO